MKLERIKVLTGFLQQSEPDVSTASEFRFGGLNNSPVIQECGLAWARCWNSSHCCCCCERRGHFRIRSALETTRFRGGIVDVPRAGCRRCSPGEKVVNLQEVEATWQQIAQQEEEPQSRGGQPGTARLSSFTKHNKKSQSNLMIIIKINNKKKKLKHNSSV